jgi:hypothetical protein
MKRFAVCLAGFTLSLMAQEAVLPAPQITAYALNMNSERVAQLRAIIPGVAPNYAPHVEVWIYDRTPMANGSGYLVMIQFGGDQRTQWVPRTGSATFAWFSGVDVTADVLFMVFPTELRLSGKAQ